VTRSAPPGGPGLASLLLAGVLALLPSTLSALALPAPTPAQPVTPDTVQVGAEAVEARLQGRLMLGGQPADTGTVVLHRVTPEEAGPLDSVRVGAGGAFQLILPALPVPGSGEVYFASARREGILYFGSALTEPAQLDSLYVVETHPTRQAPAGGLPFAVEVRNLFIDQGPMGWRATDLFQIRNDSAYTWISGADDPVDGQMVWSYPLPTGAVSPRVGQSDLSPDAVRFDEGGIQVYSPVPPGDRLFVVQYELEELEFSLPLPGETGIVEVLVDEAAPSLRMEGLRADQPVEMEPGTVYRRWSGQELSNRVVRVAPGQEGDDQVFPWIALGLALLLAAAGFWAVWRSGGEPSGGPAGGPSPGGRAQVLMEVARLDEEFDAVEAPSEEERDRYRARRRDLLARLDRLPTPGGETR